MCVWVRVLRSKCHEIQEENGGWQSEAKRDALDWMRNLLLSWSHLDLNAEAKWQRLRMPGQGCNTRGNDKEYAEIQDEWIS